MNENKKVAGVFSDAAGNRSSKRIIGAMTMVTGLTIAVISAWRYPEGASQVLWPVMVSGGALLGVTVLEKR